MEVEELDLDIADDTTNISSSLPESYASRHVQSCDLWCFLFHILKIRKILIFERLFFLKIGLFVFLFSHNSVNGNIFFHSAQHCAYCVYHHGLIFIPNIS